MNVALFAHFQDSAVFQFFQRPMAEQKPRVEHPADYEGIDLTDECTRRILFESSSAAKYFLKTGPDRFAVQRWMFRTACFHAEETVRQVGLRDTFDCHFCVAMVSARLSNSRVARGNKYREHWAVS